VARFFNIAGPCNPERHYMLPAEARLPDLLGLVEQDQYFVLHAARQTGKTTAMRAFAARLRERGLVAVHATLETSQGFTEVSAAEPQWIQAITHAAALVLPAPQCPPPVGAEVPVGARLHAFLSAWSREVHGRVVVLLDEVNVVSGPALVSLLRQLRAGFPDRPHAFPASIGLVGMRDLRDYLATAKDGSAVNPGSPFNIKSDSVTLRNFSAEEVGVLYAQHATDTGQAFSPAAVARSFWWTQGQPFLVNALARIAVGQLAAGATAVTDAHVDQAKERLVAARTTHLDSLAERMKEPRVARIVEAVIAGDIPRAIAFDSDDFQYALDLGLLRHGEQGAEAACPLYREVLARQVTHNLQASLPPPNWPWRTAGGRLDFPALVEAFRSWWRANADMLVSDIALYPEAVPHIAFMAFLQRVVNGGGRVEREYASGRGAVDIVVDYAGDRFVVELKRVRPRDGLDAVRASGEAQLSAYLDALGLREGWLLVFDQHPGRSWEDRLWSGEVEVDGRLLRVRGV